MDGFFKAFLILFFTFFVVAVAGELIRWNNYQEMVYKEIQIASLDAIALTVDDQLKQDNILYISDPAETQRIFEELINKNLQISIVGSKVLRSDYFIHSVQIKDFQIRRGSYHPSGDILVQDAYPEIIVKGNFEMVPMMARFDDFYLEADIHNRTEYIFAP